MGVATIGRDESAVGAAQVDAPRRSPLQRLFEPVDSAPLAYFRVAFGLIMLWEVVRYTSYGWIARYFIEPSFHFTYSGFEWVRPWTPLGMYLHFAALGVLALCITVGLWYRLSAALFFLGFTYVFLLEQSLYLNHLYLVCLVSFLLIFLPVHRAYSVDAWRRPAPRSDTAPTWALWLLRFQIAIPYVYGGLAKLNPDWLQGQPMRIWLGDMDDRSVVGALLTQEWAAYLFSYGGLLVDLTVVPLLLWSRTRPLGVALVLIFNLMNAWLFSIGIFPWFMIAATVLFFPPDSIRLELRRLGDWLRRGSAEIPRTPAITQAADPRLVAPAPLPPALSRSQRATVALLAAYVTFQLLFPFRHHLYPGDVAWTEEGHQFSWRMKLRDKQGHVQFVARDLASNHTWPVDARPYLTSWQYNEMAGEPELILQFAHHLADRLEQEGYERIAVHVLANVSLNGRRPQLLVDPAVDLTTKRRELWPPADWIVPLAEPLR